nr:uncharacterized protein LOC109155154 [Ipomoea batatas]
MTILDELAHAKVGDYILPNRSWDFDNLQIILPHEEVNKIRSIPIPLDAANKNHREVPNVPLVGGESIDHILMHCDFAQACWRRTHTPTSFTFGPATLFRKWLKRNCSSDDTMNGIPWCLTFSYTCWELWKARNRRIFDRVTATPKDIVHRAESMAKESFLIGYQEDKFKILRIPLPIADQADRIIWSREDNGSYSVRSCYKALVGHLPHSTNLKWSKIWNLPIPPKVKLLAWQACTNALPTVDNLIAKRVNCSDRCMLCKDAMESAPHLFIHCDVAKSCWSKINLSPSAPNCRFLEWLELNMELLQVKDLCLLLTTCWKIWQVRNCKVWNNRTAQTGKILEDAACYLEAWTSIHTKEAILHEPHPCVKWQRPPSGFLKLNVDAANDQHAHATGLGMILRDSTGSFVGALQVKINGSYQPKVAEAMGFQEALKWIKSINADFVQIESDALLVVERIKNSFSCSSFDLILDDIRVLANVLSCVSFVFAKRSANKAAHLLARDALLLSDRKDWGPFPPPFLLDVLHSDLL